MKDMNINKETHPGKVAAVFDDKSKAQAAQKTLIDYGHFSTKDVDLIQPDDAKARHKIEPETRAIGKTLWRSHFILGAVGLVAGLVVAAIVTTIGPVFAQSSPALTFMALGLVGTFFGLFAAGAITLRPDHDPLINDILEAIKHNKWVVIVHTRDHGDQQRARQLLQPAAVFVTDTF